MSKVLLVDDEGRFRTSLARRLRARGWDVVDVDSGEAAVKAVRRDGDLNIAVLDLRMPGMDGIQTLKELRAFNPAIQAIMLTGHGSLDSARDAGHLEAFTSNTWKSPATWRSSPPSWTRLASMWSTPGHATRWRTTRWSRAHRGAGSSASTTRARYSSSWVPCSSSPWSWHPRRHG